MARAVRIAFKNALYHLSANGNRREDVFLSKDDFTRFEQLLAESLERYEIELHCYVILPNHFHLVARTLRPNVSRWMHWLITTYSVWFNRTHKFAGHVFQGRYKGFLVQEGDYLVELSRYLHLNPVRCAPRANENSDERQTRLRDYQWSSYRGYAGISEQKSFVRQNLVLRDFSDGNSSQKTKMQYREFVEEGLRLNIASPFQDVRRQLALGDESFARRVTERIRASHLRRQTLTGRKRRAHLSQATELIDRVARHYGVARKTITDRVIPGSEARNVAIWLLRQKSGLTLREIGQMFGGIDDAAVSQRVRRLNQRIASRKRLRRTCKTLSV